MAKHPKKTGHKTGHKSSHKSVNIREALNGFIVSSFDDEVGKDKTSIHKNINGAMLAARMMINGKLVSEKQAQKMFAGK